MACLLALLLDEYWSLPADESHECRACRPGGDINEPRLYQHGRNAPHVGLHHHPMTDQRRDHMGKNAVGGRFEIGQEEESARFQYPEYLRKPLALEVVRKMVDHYPADHDIEGGIRVG